MRAMTTLLGMMDPTAMKTTTTMVGGKFYNKTEILIFQTGDHSSSYDRDADGNASYENHDQGYGWNEDNEGNREYH